MTSVSVSVWQWFYIDMNRNNNNIDPRPIWTAIVTDNIARVCIMLIMDQEWKYFKIFMIRNVITNNHNKHNIFFFVMSFIYTFLLEKKITKPEWKAWSGTLRSKYTNDCLIVNVQNYRVRVIVFMQPSVAIMMSDFIIAEVV